MLEELVHQVEKHDIHPVVGETFTWRDAPKAFVSMMKQGTVGKIVITIEEEKTQLWPRQLEE
jgi:NADPH:quinone reductase-like Zn-dependent oxidoreductase